MAAANPGIYEVVDRRFAPLTRGDVGLEVLHTGCRWTEGPVYVPAGRYLLWSDIPNDRILRWDEQTRHVGVFRSPAGYTNGHTLDRYGRLVSCEHGARRVTRTEHDGSITVLADRFDDRRLNSPNDVVVAADDAVWFTDPAYGIDSVYEGHLAASEIGSSNVYRVDPATGDCRLMRDDCVRPNGLAFSADQRTLYVSDTGASHVPDGPRHIRRFDVVGDAVAGVRLVGGEVFATCTVGAFDGFRLDADGRIWSSAGDGVHCYDADGTLLGKILVPEVVANVVFGGPKRNHLFICATTSVYAVMLPVAGAPVAVDRVGADGGAGHRA